MRARSFLILAALLAAFGLSTSCQQKPDPAPQPLPPPPLEYLGEWGVKGDGPGQFSRPVWLATDFAGNVYVADAGNGFVHKFDPQGRPLLSFEEHRLKQPTGVAVDRGGAIYVTDGQRGSVFIFLPDGERFREIRTGAEKGSPAPVSIAVDDEGNLYVVERASNQIQKFNPRGRLLKTWDLKADNAGQLLFPAGVAVGPDGFLYVVDRQGTHVQKLTREGEFVSGWTKPQSELRVDDSPDVRSGIAVSEKYVFLADAVNTWRAGLDARWPAQARRRSGWPASLGYRHILPSCVQPTRRAAYSRLCWYSSAALSHQLLSADPRVRRI